MELGFTNLLIISVVAFTAPLLLGMAPSVALPAVVLEIVLGIVIGPSVLGWVEVDEPVAVLSFVGLAFLLFLAGLEIDFRQLRGRPLRVAGAGFAVSFAVALVVCAVLKAVDLIDDVVFVAIVLSATSLGIVIPVLKDRGESGSPFAVVAVGLAIVGAERLRPLSATLRRLQDTTAQIRVRGAFVLLIGLSALAAELGLEVILGAFLAGAIVTLVDRPLIGAERVLPAALLQATSLPFIVAATAIGLEIGVISPAGAAALIAAGLLSVVAFPALAVSRLR